jgi:hypothetical protein
MLIYVVSKPMAKININIPQQKIRSFLKLNGKLTPGEDSTGAPAKPALVNELSLKNIRRHISPFLLFDWEFFSNELEFE